jgi:hypothetical protein
LDPTILTIIGGANLINAFSHWFTKNVAPQLSEGVHANQPVRDAEDNTLALERPDRRFSVAKRLVNGEEALGIYLEKDEGSAYQTALALKEQEPERVSIEVVGFAQSVWPKESRANEDAVAGDLAPGSSVGHMHGWAGSLGAFVGFKYLKDKNTYKGFTSAAHVLGINNKAEKGDPVISPGRPDGVVDIDAKVGKLGRCAYLTHYSEQNDPNAVLNTADIAAVELDDETTCPEANLVRDPKNPKEPMPITGVLDLDGLINHLESPVYMVGRTSGFSKGVLDGTNLAAFPIKLPNNRNYFYSELSVVRPQTSKRMFSAAGDSGALVYTADGMAAGFLIAGSPKRSFFHPAYLCLQQVGAKLI